MCSGNGTNFENIVRTCRDDEVVVMVHNKEKCGAAKRADKFGIPHTHIKSKNEDLIIDVMNAWKVDLIVLAGWMRIVTPKLINAFPDRIINLHPSMLPKYKGLHAIERALESGANTSAIVTKKQTLRDLPAQVDSLNVTETTVVGISSQIKAVWNDELLGAFPYDAGSVITTMEDMQTWDASIGVST